MRTTIIPAQITTVEDKLAGNLNFTQLLLLIFPVFISTALYIVLFPAMELAVYKLVIMAVLTTCCLVLAIRIKEKLVLEWLQLILRYNLRPARYVHSKDRVTARTVDLPDVPKPAPAITKAKQQSAKVTQVTENMRDFIQLEYLLQTQSLSFKFAKKGELHVSME